MSPSRLDSRFGPFESAAMHVEVEQTYLSSNGVTLHVLRAGPQDGPLLILLHGFPEFAHAWRRYILAFAQAGFRVIAPDQRGYNLSDKPPRVTDYVYDELAADVLGLIDSEGRKKASLVGHDWGAAVVWWTAMRHPDRVHKACTINVPHPEVMRATLLGGGLRQKLKSAYMFYFQVPLLPERSIMKADGRSLFDRIVASSRPGTFSKADEAVYLKAWAQPEAPRAMLDWYRAALRQTQGPQPESFRIKVPMLVLWGRKDELLGVELVQPSLELCDAGRVIWFDQATHWVHHEEFDAVYAELMEFLK